MVGRHIFYNGLEILDNNFEETEWFPPYNKTKRFYIHKNNINLYLDRHQKPIIGEFSSGCFHIDKVKLQLNFLSYIWGVL